MTDLAHQIRETRLRLGLPARVVAERFEVSLRTVQRWEAGDMNIHPLRVRTIRRWINENQERE